MQLLALYKVFRPELVSFSMPSRMRVSVSVLKAAHTAVRVRNLTSACFCELFQTGFKNHNSTWKAALKAVQRKNRTEVMADLSVTVGGKEKPTSRKRVRFFFNSVTLMLLV